MTPISDNRITLIEGLARAAREDRGLAYDEFRKNCFPSDVLSLCEQARRFERKICHRWQMECGAFVLIDIPKNMSEKDAESLKGLLRFVIDHELSEPTA